MTSEQKNTESEASCLSLNVVVALVTEAPLNSPNCKCRSEWQKVHKWISPVSDDEYQLVQFAIKYFSVAHGGSEATFTWGKFVCRAYAQRKQSEDILTEQTQDTILLQNGLILIFISS